MFVHVIADTREKLSALCTMLEHKCQVTSELLSGASVRGRKIDAVVVAVDLSYIDNISALKAVSAKVTRVPKRIFPD